MSNLNDIINQQREEIDQLRQQLAKANERASELEEDLIATQNQSSECESTIEEIQLVFTDSDACPLFEPFNANELSEWINQFAIEKKIEGMQRVIDCRELNLSQGEIDTIKLMQEQLRKGGE